MSLSSEEKVHRLQRAIECGGPTHTLSDVIATLHAEKAKLFEEHDGCIIAEINTFPLHKAVNFWLISGALRDCLALEDRVLAWGLDQGCTIATATGRKGWGRVAAPTGWRPALPTFWKPITEQGATLFGGSRHVE